MTGKKIIIAGGTGFIGQGLIKYFGKENNIIILSRQSSDQNNNLYSKGLLTAKDGFRVAYVKWDGKTLEDSWAREINGADLIINLAGKSVNCRYHHKQKEEIFDSRTDATKVIGDAIRKVGSPPSLWINAASATIYRHSPDNVNDEYCGKISDLKRDNMPYNLLDELRFKKNRLVARLLHGKNSRQFIELIYDFSVRVCKLWEKTFFDQSTSFTNKIALRTAITLGEGGVITPYLNLCKFGLGGKHGNGKQMFSWVHIDDVARMIDWLFDNKKPGGVYNCVAPGAVSNYSFMKTLRKLTGHSFGLPSPSWILELGAFLIGTETELILKSRWVVPAKAIEEDFVFKYSSAKDALENIVSNLPRRKYHLF